MKTNLPLTHFEVSGRSLQMKEDSSRLRQLMACLRGIRRVVHCQSS
jgi:hypothetical protein